jgi:site-specific DNA-cytosine methylase
MRLYTDIDPFCCEVLCARVCDGSLPMGEVWQRDISTISDNVLRVFTQIHLFAGIGGSALGLLRAGWPDDWSIVTGGFPCQSVSTSGNMRGESDPRFLWPEMYRVIDIVRPDWVIVENSPALRNLGADRVLGDMERIGYSATPLVVGAHDVGAPQKSRRAWLVASSSRLRPSPEIHKGGLRASGGARQTTDAVRPVRHAWPRGPGAVSEIPRGTYGLPAGMVPNRGRQVQALGNAQVPQVVEVIARAMMQTGATP